MRMVAVNLKLPAAGFWQEQIQKRTKTQQRQTWCQTFSTSMQRMLSNEYTVPLRLRFKRQDHLAIFIPISSSQGRFCSLLHCRVRYSLPQDQPTVPPDMRSDL